MSEDEVFGARAQDQDDVAMMRALADRLNTEQPEPLAPVRDTAPAGDTGPAVGEVYTPDEDAAAEGFYTGPVKGEDTPETVTSSALTMNPLQALMDRNRAGVSEETVTVRVKNVPGDSTAHEWAFRYSVDITEDDLSVYRQTMFGKQLAKLGTSMEIDTSKTRPYQAGAVLLSRKLVGVLCDGKELNDMGQERKPGEKPLTAESGLFRSAQIRPGETGTPSPDVAVSRWLRRFGTDAHVKILQKRAGMNQDTGDLEMDPTGD